MRSGLHLSTFGLVVGLVYGTGVGATSSFAAEETLSPKKRFTITTLNIKWYGNKAKEPRDKTLKKFIREKLSYSDGILFQEIVDVERLKTKVMGKDYNCYNYAINNAGHQSVVLCLKKDFRLVKESDDNNWQVDDVAYSNGARPALSGLIEDRKGRGMLHVLGVHLKAFPEKTDVRLMQTDHLAERIDTYPDDLPVVVLGDFNSHTKGKNKKKRDDKFLILDILDEVGMDLVDLGERNTWTSKSNRAQLDQIYLSSDIRTLADARIDGPCNNDRNQDNAKDFENLEYYLKNVSDHCPVTLELEI